MTVAVDPFLDEGAHFIMFPRNQNRETFYEIALFRTSDWALSIEFILINFVGRLYWTVITAAIFRCFGRWSN